MSLYGVELNSQVNRLQMQIRSQLAMTKYIPNFRTLYRSFVKFDLEVTGIIQLHHFEKALNQNGVFLKKYETQILKKAYQQGNKINWFGFMSHLRQPMGPARRNLIEQIFDSMDAEQKGSISTENLMSFFNTKIIESYKMGIKSIQSVHEQFLSLLSIPEDSVSRDEFIAFYDDLNINFVHNQVFFRFVSEMWNYTMEKVEAVKESEVKRIIKELRFKLWEYSQGTKDKYYVAKLFKQFDQNGNGIISAYDLDKMIHKLGLQANSRYIQPVLVKLDKNGTGYIELDDFKQFLDRDPYPL